MTSTSLNPSSSPNLYRDFVQTTEITSLALLWIRLGRPLKGNWRMVNDPKRGEFHGLSHMSGKQIATDGSQLYLQREDGTLWLGHITNFVPDKVERESVTHKASTSTSTSTSVSRKPKADKIDKHVAVLFE